MTKRTIRGPRPLVIPYGEGAPALGVAFRTTGHIQLTCYDKRRVEGKKDVVAYYRSATREEVKDLERRERAAARFFFERGGPVPAFDPYEPSEEAEAIRAEVRSRFNLDPFHPDERAVLNRLIRELQNRGGRDHD